jgi:ketosteroid isomerase-like protein
MDAREIEILADRFARAVEDFDFDALGEVYADDVAIWHNYDEIDQTKAQGLKSLAWVQRHTQDYRWDKRRVDVLADGWVQQHVTTASSPAIAVPTMMRVWCGGGQVVRVEHYLDSARFAPLLG